MKKIFIFILFSTFLFSKGSNNSGGSNSGNSENKEKIQITEKTNEKKSNNNLKDDVARYNWGQEKTEYTTIEERELAKETIKHYGNLMKITYEYQYTITSDEAYKVFMELFESGEINWDEVTLNKLMLEFQRHDGKLTEKEFEEIVIEIGNDVE